MDIERHAAEIGIGIDAAARERIKSATFPEFLLCLETRLEEEFGQALAKGTRVKEIIGDILKMPEEGYNKLFTVLRTERIIDFAEPASTSLPALMLPRDNSMAMGAIFFVADRKNPGLINKVDSWEEIYLETRRELINCQKPKIAGLIHIKKENRLAKKLIRAADVKKPEPGYQPDEETLSAADAYNQAKIKEIQEKIKGKPFDSLEAFGEFPYDIAKLVIRMYTNSNKQLGLNERDDEQIWLLPMSMYKKALEWCLKNMEEKDLQDLHKLYMAMRKKGII